MSWQKPRTFNSITDGTSNTLAMGETVLNPNFASAGTGVNSNSYSWMHTVGCSGVGSIPLNSTNGTTPYVAANPPVYDGRGFNSNHSGGVSFVLADGAVRFLSTSLPVTELRKLASMNGGETITGDY